MATRISTLALASVAGLLALTSGIVALWCGLAGVSGELSEKTGGRGLSWLVGMALTVQVVAAAGFVAGRRFHRQLVSAPG